MQNLGQTIKKIREQKGLSQEYMAEKLGKSQSQYSRLENSGDHINHDVLRKIAILLDREVEDFFPASDKQAFSNHHNAEISYSNILVEEIKFLKNNLEEKDVQLKEKDRQIEHKDKQIESRDRQIEILIRGNFKIQEKGSMKK